MSSQGSRRGEKTERTGKSWHQSAHMALHGPGCGMCQEAYAAGDHTACAWSQRRRRKKTVSRVAGRKYTTWQHQPRVLSTSQGVLLIIRGTAECSARKTVDRGYPDKQANCAQEATLRRQLAQVCRNGCMLRTALTMMFDISLGDIRFHANTERFQGLVPLWPHLCPLSVRLGGVCGSYSESP